MNSIFLALFLLLLPGMKAISAEKPGCEFQFTKLEMNPRNVANALRKIGYTLDAAKRISELRPDVALAILKIKQGGKNPYETFAPGVLPAGFLRENLNPFFSSNLWKPVKLYRGVDQAEISAKMEGEKLLIWTSQHLSDTIPYALTNSNSKTGLILQFEVPRFLVRERSGWPVLRFEDVPDIRPFLERVGVIRISQALRSTIERFPGDKNAYQRAIEKQAPGFFNGFGKSWSTGKAKDQFISTD